MLCASNNLLAATNKLCTQASPLGLFYLDELRNRTGQALFTWKQLCFLKNRSAKGKVPTWFQLLSSWHARLWPAFSDVLNDNDAHAPLLSATTNINDSSPTVFTYKPTEDRRRSEFVYMYQHHPHNGIYLGKIVKKANDLSFYVAHWLLDSNASNIITPCPGCHLHHPGQGRHN